MDTSGGEVEGSNPLKYNQIKRKLNQKRFLVTSLRRASNEGVRTRNTMM